MLRTKPDTGTAHTPGEWTVSRSKMETDGAFDYAISADGAPVIAEAFGRDAKGGWPNAEANARLIASAPELAAMVRELLKIHEAHHNHPTHGAARRLLSKAEGRQP